MQYPQGAYTDIDALMAMLQLRQKVGRNVIQMRKDLDAFGQLFSLAPGVKLKPIQVAGRPAEYVIPEHRRVTGCILYLHGGGYVGGSITSHRHLASYLASETASAVLIVDYRLAPEAPFPAAVLDAELAYNRLLEEGFESANIAIAGDSAGGGLAISLMLRLKMKGAALPGACVCLSPWVDLNQKKGSWIVHAKQDLLVNKKEADYMAGLYLQGHSAYDAVASPVFADLSGLPPLLIHVGSREVLFDDATTLHQLARQHGVDSTLEVWPYMPHVGHFMASILPEGQKAIKSISSFLYVHQVFRERS